MFQYHVDAFTPPAAGCSSSDNGWDPKRCTQFTEFLNHYAQQGWKLHSYEYRTVDIKGCSGGKGAWLVCVFERQVP